MITRFDQIWIFHRFHDFSKNVVESLNRAAHELDRLFIFEINSFFISSKNKNHLLASMYDINRNFHAIWSKMDISSFLQLFQKRRREPKSSCARTRFLWILLSSSPYIQRDANWFLVSNQPKPNLIKWKMKLQIKIKMKNKNKNKNYKTKIKIKIDCKFAKSILDSTRLDSTRLDSTREPTWQSDANANQIVIIQFQFQTVDESRSCLVSFHRLVESIHKIQSLNSWHDSSSCFSIRQSSSFASW